MITVYLTPFILSKASGGYFFSLLLQSRGGGGQQQQPKDTSTEDQKEDESNTQVPLIHLSVEPSSGFTHFICMYKDFI